MKASDNRVLLLAAGAFFIFAAGSAGQKPATSQPASQSSTKSVANPQAQRAAPKPAPLEVPQLKFEKYKLQNGLVVILSEDHRLPMVAVNLWKISPTEMWRRDCSTNSFRKDIRTMTMSSVPTRTFNPQSSKMSGTFSSSTMLLTMQASRSSETSSPNTPKNL